MLVRGTTIYADVLRRRYWDSDGTIDFVLLNRGGQILRRKAKFRG
jgi:hypothetical protein